MAVWTLVVGSKQRTIFMMIPSTGPAPIRHTSQLTVFIRLLCMPGHVRLCDGRLQRCLLKGVRFPRRSAIAAIVSINWLNRLWHKAQSRVTICSYSTTNL